MRPTTARCPKRLFKFLFLDTSGDSVQLLRSYPVYVRGLSYLAAHPGVEAAVEFRKILKHRGIVRNDPIDALAHLQLGRAFLLLGDARKTKAGSRIFSISGKMLTQTSRCSCKLRNNTPSFPEAREAGRSVACLRFRV